MLGIASAWIIGIAVLSSPGLIPAPAPDRAPVAVDASESSAAPRVSHLGTSGQDTARREPGAGAVPAPDAPEGMAWIPGGRFVMGTDDAEAWPAERPAHRVHVDGFFMDIHEVTNAQFAAFVEATGYVTVAERPVDWAELRRQLPPGTPEPPAESLQPGSLVFTPPDHAVDARSADRAAQERWWSWVRGACWRAPEGPGSSIEDRMDHPVVHVAWEDAAAYAAWAGKRLPTEAEWERAARGGMDGATFVWGEDAPTDDGPARANIWQGEFPHRNLETDGFARTAPVMSYAPNRFGLHDMAGNVWEWCSDWYRVDAYERRVRRQPPGRIVRNPTGPGRSYDPGAPRSLQRVTRGGSFLCHPSYCSSYRPSARVGTAYDSGMSHLGFRCVRDVE